MTFRTRLLAGFGVVVLVPLAVQRGELGKAVG